MEGETAWLLVLELYRENKVSLGRAAELCRTPVRNSWYSPEGMMFRCTTALKNWKKTGARCSGSAYDSCLQLVPLITLARIRRLELLATFYGRIVIPSTVHEEVTIARLPCWPSLFPHFRSPARTVSSNAACGAKLSFYLGLDYISPVKAA